MTVRGEFVRGDGLVLPNNVTPYGRRVILDSAFRKNSIGFIAGLCDALYVPGLLYNELNQPVTEGSYARQDLTRGMEDWVTLGELNGEVFVESRPLIFPAQEYDRGFSRLYIVDQSEPPQLVAMSAAAPSPLRITTFTPEPERTFKYRLYLG